MLDAARAQRGLPELPQRQMSQQEELDSLLPVWMVKARQKEEQKEVDKPCKYHMHGYQCYEELKWGYCSYIHAEELKAAFEIASA